MEQLTKCIHTKSKSCHYIYNQQLKGQYITHSPCILKTYIIKKLDYYTSELLLIYFTIILCSINLLRYIWHLVVVIKML